ncbi:hypothetical protein G7046_g10133 [Stylonectria norvegica]|nr:hypothetical protein G7046_g10133 [Stylonectria norvegica]
MQGGGTGQFSSVVYNLVGAWVARKQAEIAVADETDPARVQALKAAVEKDLKLDYVVTGGWSQKASEEAARLLGPEHVNVVADARKGPRRRGQVRPYPRREHVEALQGCGAGVLLRQRDNGVEFPAFPKALQPGPDGEGPIVVADMSSNILSRRIPVKNYSVLFFGAQKNLGSTGITVVVIKKSLLPPTTPQPSATLMRQLGLPIAPIVFQYETIAKNNSLYNTLSIFDVYIAGQVLKKLLKTYPNKVDGQESVSNTKSQLIYSALDAHPTIYKVCPTSGDTDATETAFLKEATALGLTGLKGHRSVGGHPGEQLQFDSS